MSWVRVVIIPSLSQHSTLPYLEKCRHWIKCGILGFHGQYWTFLGSRALFVHYNGLQKMNHIGETFQECFYYINWLCYFYFVQQEHGLVALTLSNYRFDALFDYGSQLPDEGAREVISKWFNFLQRSVQPYIERRNRYRLAEGHLSYPYLQPRWIPNGIQT